MATRLAWGWRHTDLYLSRFRALDGFGSWNDFWLQHEIAQTSDLLKAQTTHLKVIFKSQKKNDPRFFAKIETNWLCFTFGSKKFSTYFNWDFIQLLVHQQLQLKPQRLLLLIIWFAFYPPIRVYLPRWWPWRRIPNPPSPSWHSGLHSLCPHVQLPPTLLNSCETFSSGLPPPRERPWYWRRRQAHQYQPPKSGCQVCRLL